MNIRLIAYAVLALLLTGTAWKITSTFKEVGRQRVQLEQNSAEIGRLNGQVEAWQTKLSEQRAAFERYQRESERMRVQLGRIEAEFRTTNVDALDEDQASAFADRMQRATRGLWHAASSGSQATGDPAGTGPGAPRQVDTGHD